MNSKRYALSAGKWIPTFWMIIPTPYSVPGKTEGQSLTVYQTNVCWKTVNQLAQGVPEQGMLYIKMSKKTLCVEICALLHTATLSV